MKKIKTFIKENSTELILLTSNIVLLTATIVLQRNLKNMTIAHNKAADAQASLYDAVVAGHTLELDPETGILWDITGVTEEIAKSKS